VFTSVSVDTLDTRKTSSPQGIQPRFFHHLAHRVVTVLTMLVCRVNKLFILLKTHWQKQFLFSVLRFTILKTKKMKQQQKQVFLDVPRFSFSPSTITAHSTFTNVLSLR